MSYWENKIESLLNPSEQETTSLLNREGLSGWELAAVTITKDSTTDFGWWTNFYLKRKLNEDEALESKRMLGMA